MTRRLLCACALLAACGGGGKPSVEPTLPDVQRSAPPPAPAAAPRAAVPARPWADPAKLIQPPPAAPPVAVSLPRVERFTLPNGLRVLVAASHELPVVAMELAVDAGGEDEPRDKRLLADYAALMLTRGTTRHRADQIASAMGFIGGSLAASADLEVTRISCASLSRDLATCLTLLPEVVTLPTFPADEMKRVADQLAGGIRQLPGDPAALARQHFDNLLWGEDHVRGWPPTIEGVRSITREDLVAWHRERFVPGAALLVVAGDVDPKQLRADLTRGFAGWKRRRAPRRPRAHEPRLQGLRVRLVDDPRLTQSRIVVGGLGVAHGDRDYLPTLLANDILGGDAFSSRLQSAAAKGGLSNDAASDFERWRTRGELVAAASTPTAQTLTTLRMLLDEMARMKAEGATEAELAAAKARVAGSYVARFQSASVVADALLTAELHGLGDDFVRDLPLRLDAVTLAQVRAAAAAHLDPEDAAVVIVGKGDDVAPQLEKAGIAFERAGALEPISRRDRAARAAAEAAPSGPAAGRRLLEQALAAKGGEAKLRAIRVLRAVGKVKLRTGGQTLEGDWTRIFAPPDRLRIDVTVPAAHQTISMTVSPDGVWQRFGETVKDMPPALAAQGRQGLWRDHDFVLLRALEPDTVVQGTGKVRVAGKTYDVVVLRRGDSKDATQLLLDPKTHLIFRLRYLEGGAPGSEEYGDYRSVDGVMLPFRQHAVGNGQVFDVTVTDYQINGKLPAGSFARPKGS